MSEQQKRGIREGVEGAVEGTKGKAKEAAGAVLGNDQLREEGRIQQERAESEREAAKHQAQAEKERAKADVQEGRQRSIQDDDS
ncbi:uncharacterized protein YjbJ (UPF0337 family) [Nocardia transvalensis]|uniref:Uncharacterized protein YjbJ (UPF0337 family) n=1 Tax=Nocardia transvalensis TaxID=37333 RepID=A0A7W9PJP7_9NOCA|nr:hypothetical protein [Nocardia transvalensis]MBB5917292.1 uncharacterized protein YjbJ (UPF0337 family) [Nocardia transvalensis]